MRGQRRGWRGTIPGQLEIPWGEAGTQGETLTISPLPSPPVVSPPAPPPLVQVLPWDFQTTFPPPLKEAVDNGLIRDEEITAQGIRGIHDEHARQILATLHDLDAFRDARHRGVDPATGKPPKSPASRKRLQKRFETEPARLEHAVEVLMDVYETVFGPDAARAFLKAIRAWHAGIKVEAEPPSKSRLPVPAGEKGNKASASPRRRVATRQRCSSPA